MGHHVLGISIPSGTTCMRLLWTVTGIGDVCWYCRYLQPLEMHIAIGDTYLLLFYCQSTEHSASQLIFQMYMCVLFLWVQYVVLQECLLQWQYCVKWECCDDCVVYTGNVARTVLCTPAVLPCQCCVHQECCVHQGCCHWNGVYTSSVAMPVMCTPGLLPGQCCVGML